MNIKILPKDLRIVAIPSPYDCWGNSSLQSLFCKTLEMRLAGYQSEYGPGVLPLDAADFVGTHYLVCRESGGGLEPLMGFRSTTWADSLRHGISFGGMGLVRAANASAHAEVMQRLMDLCQIEGRSIAYVGSWTMAPEARKDLALRSLLRELFLALIVHAHADSQTWIISGCTMRFKVDQWTSSWGFKPFRDEKGELPPIRVPFLLGERVRMMYLEKFTEEAIRDAAPWRPAWEQRTVITGNESGAQILQFRKAA